MKDKEAENGWLAATKDAFRRAVLSRCLVRHFAQGETIYRAGDEPGGLFGLVEGGVDIIVAPNDRTPFLGIIARPGFWIGEGSVITRRPRAVGVVASRDSRFAYLPLCQWDAIVGSDPDAWRWLACLALSNELFALAVVDALRTRKSADRLAAILAVLASNFGAPMQGQAPDGHALTIDVSQDDLANMANLSRSSVGRILDALEAKAIIGRSYRLLTILDFEGLRRGRDD